MINMILQKLLPTIIHCSELSGVVRKDSFGGVLKFEVLKSSNLQSNNNAFATKTPRHKGSQSPKSSISNFAALRISLCGLCVKCILSAHMYLCYPI